MSRVAEHIARQLARAGRPVSVEKEGQLLHFAACIQPRGGGQAGNLPTPLGRADQLEYLYRGPATGAGALLQEGDLLLCGSLRFVLGGLRDYYWAGAMVLRTAVLTRCPGAEEVGG